MGLKSAAVQAAPMEYYSAGHHLESDVADITKARAAHIESGPIPRSEVGKFEIASLQVSTANTIPTLYWHLVFIASNSALVLEIRKELLSISTISPPRDGHREIKTDITKFEDCCPLFVSSYHETIRLANSQMSTRRVMADTIINDGKNSYFLREGVDVQIPAGVTHIDTALWGPNALSFDPRRCIKLDVKMSKKEKANDKEQKKAYFPFGDILGTVAVLLLGFEVQTNDGGLIQRHELGRARLVEAIAKPRGKALSMGARITRRKGWEDAVWKFVTDKE